MAVARTGSWQARLARLGFTDVARAEAGLAQLAQQAAEADHARAGGRMGAPPATDPAPTDAVSGDVKGTVATPGNLAIAGTDARPGGGAVDGSGPSTAADSGLPSGLIDRFADVADPDQALSALVALASAHRRADGGADSGLLGRLAENPAGAVRLVTLLGVSEALGTHLVRHPNHVSAVLDDGVVTARPTRAGFVAALADAVAAVALRDGPGAGPSRQVVEALRVAYRRQLLGVVVRDLAGVSQVRDVAAELADLAEATLSTALEIARAAVPDRGESCRLAVIGMGKCGGRELNYVSDVDVIFVAEPAAGADEAAALRSATAWASALIMVCGQTTAEGTIWPVDAALRPEGRAGPLVRTLASHEAYYRRWAKTWEFQALLKARPVAGDPALGSEYVGRLEPLLWRAAERDGFVSDVQAMRRRVEEHLPRDQADRDVKLGPGGLRDVEFAVQLLQLVHGRADTTLRSGSTLVALQALAAGGYVSRHDAHELDAAYRFLRQVEHLLQLRRLRRTRVLPTNESELRVLARAMGCRRDPVPSFTTQRAGHAAVVRRLHEKLFYRPLLDAVARLPVEETRLTRQAAATRLEALGFDDPAAALRHIEALTVGLSRRAAIQKTLLPVMLGWFAAAPDPDAGLLSFRQVSDSLGSTPWYLRLLRDNAVVGERLAIVLATSRFASDLLTRHPEGVRLLSDDAELAPRSRGALRREVLAIIRRSDDWDAAVRAARAIRRRELLRVAAADILGLLDPVGVGQALSDVTAAALAASLRSATEKIATENRTHPSKLPVTVALIAMGRLGGHEQGYASDADVLFLHEARYGAPEAVATAAASDIAAETRRLLGVPALDPALIVDADLRPEGRRGPLTRSLASYAEYYGRWASVWESQALLRAEPVAGDTDLAERFVQLVDPVRYREAGITTTETQEIRRLKARMEAERLPKGADPTLHTKLGRGGLSDVEWTVQLLQLRHAGAIPALRTTSTIAALRAAVRHSLLDPSEAATLEQAWLLAARVRNAVMLVRGRPSDSLPTQSKDLGGVARAVGYPAGQAGQLIDDYRRLTRRARGVVERVFYA